MYMGNTTVWADVIQHIELDKVVVTFCQKTPVCVLFC